jgi:hypothetical protein
MNENLWKMRDIVGARFGLNDNKLKAKIHGKLHGFWFVL